MKAQSDATHHDIASAAQPWCWSAGPYCLGLPVTTECTVHSRDVRARSSCLEPRACDYGLPDATQQQAIIGLSRAPSVVGVDQRYCSRDALVPAIRRRGRKGPYEPRRQDKAQRVIHCPTLFSDNPRRRGADNIYKCRHTDIQALGNVPPALPSQ
jgi:hypothetical protein